MEITYAVIVDFLPKSSRSEYILSKLKELTWTTGEEALNTRSSGFTMAGGPSRREPTAGGRCPRFGPCRHGWPQQGWITAAGGRAGLHVGWPPGLCFVAAWTALSGRAASLQDGAAHLQREADRAPELRTKARSDALLETLKRINRRIGDQGM